MRELDYILDTILALIVGTFLLRLLMQFIRTDFRNPLAQAILRVTSPVVVPLRRVLPPIGRLDTASAVAMLVAELFRLASHNFLQGQVATPGRFAVDAAVDLAGTTLWLYLGAIFVYALLSWLDQSGGYNPGARLLGDLTAPILRPLRRILPMIGGLDLSPFAAILLLRLAQMILFGRIAPLLYQLLG
jgi:YggT family protein